MFRSSPFVVRSTTTTCYNRVRSTSSSSSSNSHRWLSVVSLSNQKNRVKNFQSTIQFHYYQIQQQHNQHQQKISSSSSSSYSSLSCITFGYKNNNFNNNKKNNTTNTNTNTNDIIVCSSNKYRYYTPMTKEEEEKEKARILHLNENEKDIELRTLNRSIAKLEMKKGILTGDLYTWTGRYKALVRDYGFPLMAYYWALYGTMGIGVYFMIGIGGIDAMDIIMKFDNFTGWSLSTKVDPAYGKIGLALVLNETLEPIRLPLVVITLKPVMEYISPPKY